MNTFFIPEIVDELTRSQWHEILHCIPAGTGGADGMGATTMTTAATPSPRVSGISQQQQPLLPDGTAAPTANSSATPTPYGAHATPSSAVGGHRSIHPSSFTPAAVTAAANAAAAVALSDISKVPPPTRALFMRFANHLTEGLCLLITDTSVMGGFGFGGVNSGGGVGNNSANAAGASSAYAPSAVTNGTLPSTFMGSALGALATLGQGGTALGGGGSGAAVRAWVAQLKPEAMLSQLQASFSHAQVGVPMLLRMVESSLASGHVAAQFVPIYGGASGGNVGGGVAVVHSTAPTLVGTPSAGTSNPPQLVTGYQLRLFLPLNVAVAKGANITVSLSVDAFALEEVVDAAAKPTCYTDFLVHTIINPMLKTQAALCGALTVLAAQGQLNMAEFMAVFRHQAVISNAADASLASTPQFWKVVTDAALPRPPPPPLPARESTTLPNSGVGTSSAPNSLTAAAMAQHGGVGGGLHDSQYGGGHQPIAPSSLIGPSPIAVGGTGGPSNTGNAGMKRVSSYVETPEERERKRALTEQLQRGARGGQQQHVAPVSPTGQLPLTGHANPLVPSAAGHNQPPQHRDAVAISPPPQQLINRRNLVAPNPYAHQPAVVGAGVVSPVGNHSVANNAPQPPPPAATTSGTTQPSAAHLKKVRKAMM